MFKSFGKKSSEVVTPLAITDEQYEQVRSALAVVNMSEDFGFKDAIQDIESYHGGSFEWTDRGEGLRLWADMNIPSQQVYAINITKHGHSYCSDEEVGRANEILAAIFA
jgi:hypothetical protein